jgi:glycine hydroxymethyltransferase
VAASAASTCSPGSPHQPYRPRLLASEAGIRAAEGHIGQVNRWFVGTKYIDEIEALCMELLKQVFRARYADHRLMGSMLGNLAVYTALAEPGDVIMSVAQPLGGHSSNRPDGPAGVRGLKVVDIPFDPIELEVDLDLFRRMAPLVKPRLVALGLSMTLFPFPLREMAEIVSEWGGRVFFDGAHQLGLIAGGQFQDPLQEGAAVLTGSAGKTFSGPQSGIIVWDDPALTGPITHAIFPRAGRHSPGQPWRYLAVSAGDFGLAYMRQIVHNAQALEPHCSDESVPVLGAHKGYYAYQQVIADAPVRRRFRGRPAPGAPT